VRAHEALPAVDDKASVRAREELSVVDDKASVKAPDVKVRDTAGKAAAHDLLLRPRLKTSLLEGT